MLPGYLAVLTTAACWGTSGIFINLIMTGSGVSATGLAFWRDFTAFLFFFVICVISRRHSMRVKKADLPWLGLMGINLGLFHVSWNFGILLNGAAVTTVQQAAMPVIVIAFARIFWHESLTWQKIVSVILIIAGTVFVSGLISANRSDLTTLGIAAGFCVPLFYSGWSMLGKKVSGQYASEVILTYAFGVAAVVLAPLQFFMPSPLPFNSMRTIIFFAGLIGIATGGGFYAFTFGLSRLPAGVASILVMSEILFVSVFAYYFLGEIMTGIQMIGAGLVMGGVVVLFQRRKKK